MQECQENSEKKERWGNKAYQVLKHYIAIIIKRVWQWHMIRQMG